jgi:glycosyltransferase involved in cell wall biosynthesis
MATIVLDGSVCLNREGACYKYYSALVPRIVEQGHNVVFTPGPPGVLDALRGPGVSVLERFTPKAPKWLPGGKLRRVLSKARLFVEKMAVGRGVRQSEAKIGGTNNEVFFSFYYNLPPAPSMPTVIIVHDLIDEIFIKQFDSEQNRILRAKRLRAVENATQIICNSECTKRDFLKAYPQFADKTVSIYIGVDFEFYRKRVSDTEAKATLSKLGLNRPYILHVGGRVNHKNFELLANAYKQGNFGSTHDLVCTGENFIDSEKQLFKELGIDKTVRHIRFPEEETLRVLYQHATVFAYPSKYEGFGIPPLEAMASDCPVIAARGGAVSEVSGGGSQLVSPDDPTEMVQALREVLDPAKAQALRNRGKQHVEKFNWNTLAARIIDVFLKAAHSR